LVGRSVLVPPVLPPDDALGTVGRRVASSSGACTRFEGSNVGAEDRTDGAFVLAAAATTGAGDGIVSSGGGVLGAAVRFPQGTEQSPTKVKTIFEAASDRIMQNRDFSELSGARLYTGGSSRE
jgi:hypothetical protein